MAYICYIGLGLERILWSGSLKTVARELVIYNLDLVGIQVVRCGKGDTKPADVYIIFYANGYSNHHIRTGFFAHKIIISAVNSLLVAISRI